MKRVITAVLAALGVVGATLVAPVLSPVTAQAAQDSATPPSPGAMPSEVPAAFTPAITGDNVQTIASVGSQMIIGGPFTAVGGTARSGLAAINATTGALNTNFAPSITGKVLAVLPGPVPDTVYVAGTISAINGTQVKKIALLNTNNGAIVTSFSAPVINGGITTLKARGGRLYLGGDFNKVGNTARGGLATLNPSTGVFDPFLDVTLTENHNWFPGSTGAKAAVGASVIDVSPDNTKMIVVGNFKKADGLDRDQAVLIDLTGASAVVKPDWRTTRYVPACASGAFDTYMRGAAWAPDGSYFVITTTGAPFTNTLCDAAARWEAGATGTDVQPTWINESGGDTLWATTITDSAVFVGGHQRWMNNPLGTDNSRSGAVPRPGLSALDPVSGRPLTWNPGRNPRGVAVFAMLATDQGLWIGMNTDWIGNRKYRRQKLAYFPYTGGTAVAKTTTATLPGTVFLGRGDPGAPNSLDATLFDGSSASAPVAVGSGIDWTTVRGAFAVGNYVYYGKSDGTFWRASFNGSSLGASENVDPYHDPKWMNVDTGSGQTFDGTTPTFYSQIPNVGGMFYSGGRLYYNQIGSSTLSSLWFSPDSGIVDGRSQATSSSISFDNVSGMFAAGGYLYHVNRTTGDLYRVAFANNVVSGAAQLVNGPSTGGIDWRARGLFVGNPPPNQQPTASFTSMCTDLECSFDASASTDGDGSLVDYTWDFGDGSTGSGVTVSHTYGSAGSKSVQLTVVDNSGGNASVTRQVVPAVAPAGTGHVGSTSTTDAKSTTKTVTPPTATQVGDTMLLTYAGDDDVPAAPAGWTLVKSTTSNTVNSTVWSKRAETADLGTAVTLTQSASRKAIVGLTVYRGFSSVAAVEATVETSTATHATPAVGVTSGDQAVAVWVDKSATTTAWTMPAGFSERVETIGSGAGRVSLVVADSGARQSTGTYPSQTATTDAPSTRSISTILVLRP